MNRSLILQHSEEDLGEQRMENLVNQVAFLVNKWKEGELEKERAEERRRQQEWEARHRSSTAPRAPAPGQVRPSSASPKKK